MLSINPSSISHMKLLKRLQITSMNPINWDKEDQVQFIKYDIILPLVLHEENHVLRVEFIGSISFCKLGNFTRGRGCSSKEAFL